MAFDDKTLADGLRALKGQGCTPAGFDRALIREIKARDLARFELPPNNHWALTRRGLDFLKARSPYGEWCVDPDLCVGKGYCPRDPTCGD